MRKIITAALAAFLVATAHAEDAELTNHKSGIDVVWGVGDGSDKGTAYQEEYWYHDKLINDTKTVYIRSTTDITMTHNSRNVASINGQRPKTVIGALGQDGLASVTHTGFSATASTNTISKTAHGFVNNQGLVFSSGTGFGGLTANRAYAVINATTDTFQLSYYRGGTAIDITSDGTSGVFIYNDEGQIRYQVDKLWYEADTWANTFPRKPLYTGPFALEDIEYESGVSVVGTTGARPATAQTSSSFYWRGMTETVGAGTEEWHVLMIADDDQCLFGFDDSWASDGKYILLNVDPKTPACTWRATGDGQFYTTPAWTYWVPTIHAQTTYIAAGTGGVTCELRNIYEANISYRINGGSAVDVGAATVTLSASDFSDGSNTLEYWYTATPTVIRTRTVVKDPAFPSAGETHGNRVWGDAAWTAFSTDRYARQPYSARVAWAQTVGPSGQADWETNRRQGRRFGDSNWPIRNGSTAFNAIMAKFLGYTATRSGAPRTYAQYAKEMLLETHLNQHPVGMEANSWSGMAIPAADLYYRGYWDSRFAYNAAVAYDILIADYKSTQVSGGITAIEDYFIRDRLADHVHQSALNLGGFAETSLGMWAVCKNIGATMITCVMPNYSTAYFGTSGMDGTTTTYDWAPYQTYNNTWKDLFVQHDYTLRSYPEGPVNRFMLEGTVAQGALIRDPGSTVTVDGQPQEATWIDRIAYTSPSQCGFNFYLYANLVKIHDPGSSHGPLEKYLDEITQGTLYGAKITTGEVYGPYRQHAILCLNQHFPTAAANATAWVQSLASTNNDSDDKALQDTELWGLFFYDDTYYGEGGADITNPTVAITSPTSSATYDAGTSATVTLGGSASDNVEVNTVTWGNSLGGSGSATYNAGTGTWEAIVPLVVGSNVITVTATDTSGNPAPDQITVTRSDPVPDPLPDIIAESASFGSLEVVP